MTDPSSAHPSWYRKVLATLARDYPEVSEAVWHTTVVENAAEQVEAGVRRRMDALDRAALMEDSS